MDDYVEDILASQYEEYDDDLAFEDYEDSTFDMEVL